MNNQDPWLQSQTFSLLQENKIGLEAQDGEQQMSVYLHTPGLDSSLSVPVGLLLYWIKPFGLLAFLAPINH